MTTTTDRASGLVLAADIGGTKTRLALLDPARGASPLVERTVASGSYDGLATLAADFLGGAGAPPVRRAVLAVAGPVVGGRAELTNLRWVVEQDALSRALDIPAVTLINDLVALAHAVPFLPPDAVHTLQHGVAEPGGGIAVVAPGTGLGAAFLTWDGAGYRAHPSEAGHADFAPTDELQGELLAWLRPRFGHVSYERVCSGRGLPNLYAFLRERGTAPEEPWLAERLAAAPDATPVIVEAALDVGRPSPLCVATLELFASILAAEAGNAALRLLATGGVFLGGGMPRRVLPFLASAALVERFRRKGRLSPILERVPLHVVVHRRAALFGAIHYALAEEASAGRG